MKNIKLHIIIVTALLFACSGSLFAQTSTIEGIVRDGTVGTPVSGITVYIINPATNTTTNGSGFYSFPSVQTGTTITVSVGVMGGGPAGSQRTFVVALGINQVNFWLNAVSDVDGNKYSAVEIGSQIWMGENLKTTKYNDGTAIPQVIDLSLWNGLTTPAYHVCDNQYGALYNWYTINTGNLCPAGWHVPTDSEWHQLASFLDPNAVLDLIESLIVGDKLKETGTTHWISPNSGASNEVGFTALPGGACGNSCGNQGRIGFWWNATELSSTHAMTRSIYGYDGGGGTAAGINREPAMKNSGLSVRCINNLLLPTVSTAPISNTTQISALSGGNITSDGGSPVTARGVCWSTSQNPTIFDNHTTDGAGTGTFTSSLTGLTPNTTYYIRAYATNSVGTGYDLNENSFTTIPIVLATLTTTVPSSITSTVAISGGNITSDGGDAVTARGVCWNITGNPTISDNHTTNGSATGSFNSGLTELAPNTTYYIRAYATNSVGTAYGNQLSFTTLSIESIIFNPGLTYGTITDIDGNSYKTIQIGSQVWMAENLKTTKYNDGPNIPLITDNASWIALTTPAYCWYNNYINYKDFYGALYNWYAINTGKLCPISWHVPSDAEWTTLTDYLGGESVAGGILKETGITHWIAPNTGASNVSGFTALPSGYRDATLGGNFYNLGSNGFWWSSTNLNVLESGRTIYNSYTRVDNLAAPYNMGYSVRCIQNTQPTLTTSSISSLTQTTAQSGGNITSDGGSPVTARGVCWNISGNPTISDNHTTDGFGTGSYLSQLTGLTPNTLYYIRAYATNGEGTSYGENISFTTLSCPVIIVTSATTASVCNNAALNYTATSSTVGATFAWTRAVVAGIDNLAGAGTTALINESLDNTTTAPVNVIYVITPSYGVCAGTPFNLVVTVNPTAAITSAATASVCDNTAMNYTATSSTMGATFAWTRAAVIGIANSAGVGATALINELLDNTTTAPVNVIYVITPSIGGCAGTPFNLVVTVNPTTVITPTITNVSCNSCNDAAINLTVTGGTLPYSFAWTGSDGYNATTQNIAALKPGAYNVVVKDASGCSQTAYAQIINPFIVTNTSDADEIGTLRYAINYANTHNAATPDLITFNIPLGIPLTIQPVSALPEIDQSLVIDGFSQPGASLTDLILQVELQGTNAGAGSNGLTIKSNNCTVKGLVIDGFSGNGIQVASGTGNTISANSIFDNGTLGIDLGTDGAVTKNDAGDADTGPNNLQNFPVLGSLSFSPGYVTVNGTLNSRPSALTYKLEFFANEVADNTGYGEGQTYLGSGTVTTNSAGNGTFTITLPTLTKYGDVITATATDPSGNTSEFSQAIGGLEDQILSSTKIPFIYQVNGQGVKSIPSTAVVNEIRSAFGNWSGISTSGMSFTYNNATPPQYASSSDNINLVTFSDDKFPFSPGILAVTAKTLKVGVNDSEDQIIDADIVFNPYYVNNSTYDFGIADNPLYTGFFDIQSVATHEIGHVLGLLHSGVYNATMWFEVGPGTDDRSLEQDDRSWLSFRYPNTNYNQTFGSISGNIKYGYNNDPVAGAIVLAVDPATDLAVVHAYSDADGNYLIPGLPTGTYRVYIMPLDGDVYGRDLRPENISSYIYSNTIYTDYPGEFYNNPDKAVETDPTPTPVIVTAGKVTSGIDFITNKDVTPPTVKSVVPASGATDVSVLPDILITFSEPVDMSTVTDQSCYLTVSGSDTKIGGKYKPDGFEDKSDIVLFTLPENALSYGSDYMLHITTGVTDLKTNQLGAEYTSTFRTGVKDLVPPTITSTIPDNNATNVFLTDKIMVFFSKPMIKSTVESSFVLTTDNGTVNVDCTPGWDGYTTFTLSPKSPLIEGKTYTLVWTNGATDLSGNKLAGGSMSFTTIPNAAPTIVYMEPGSNLTTTVAVETAVVVDFSEPIDVATVTNSTFKLLSGSSQVSGKIEFLNENSRVIFTPAANLTFGQTYNINLTTGIQDVSQVKQNFAGATKTFTADTKPSKPHIDSNDPAGSIGNTIEIDGNGFDPNPSKDKVTFVTLTSSVSAFATTATLTTLTVKIPYGAVSGAIRVTANGVLDDQDSNSPTTYIFIGSFTDPCNTATPSIVTGSQPHGGAVDFNGANAYITNSGESTVSVITNLNTDDPVKKPPYELTRIQVGKTPMNICINATGTRAYVTNFDSHTVSVIDLTDINNTKNQVIGTIKVGVHPYGVVANGDKVYVANYGSDNITVINVDPASGGFDHATANINTGTNNRDIDISADGGTLAVTGNNGLTLVKITKTALGYDYGVSNSNPGASTQDAKITKDGGTAIVTTTEGNIFFVDIAPGDNYGAATRNINPPSNAGNGGITFDGLFYYVTNPDDKQVTVYRITYEGSGSGSGTVSSSAGLTLKVYATIPVGTSPEGIAMDPVNDKVVVVNSGSNNVTPIYICCPAVKTPSAYIKDLIFAVENMIYSGDISKLRGYVLIFTLNSSLRNINAGRTKLAIADLKAFIALVNTYSKNKQISTKNGNALVAAANAIIAKLQGTKSEDEELNLNDSINQSNQEIIAKTQLGSIYPNPGSESVTISYEVSTDDLYSGKVTIQIYDMIGRLIENLVNNVMEPGRYIVTWNRSSLNGIPVPKGIYFIKLKAGKTVQVKQIMLVR